MKLKPKSLILRSHLARTTLFLGVVLGSVLWAAADSVVLPQEAGNAPGNSSLVWGLGSQRVQEVFNSEILAPHMPNGAWITGVSFRRNEAAPSGTATLGLVEVRLSTSARRADTVSRFFSQNVGPDETLVFRQESVQWTFTAGVGLRPFEAVISFMTPYLYDPGQGSLLLDVLMLDGTLNTTIDAHVDPVGRVAQVVGFPSDPGERRPWGPVVRLDFTPIPEPGSGSLFVGGCAVLVLGLVRSQRSFARP
jgi:hypothetical protein